MGLKKSSAHEPLHQVVEREHVRDLPGLLAALRSGDAEQRRWAARDLATEPRAAGALAEALLQERDSRVRDALFVSLSGLRTEATVTALLPLLRSDDAGLRNGAIEALAGMPQLLAPQVQRLLADADPDVRILTVNLLGELRHPQVPDWLLPVLAQDTEVNVVAAAVEAMAEAGSPRHVAALQAVRERFAGDAFIGFAVDLAIERIEAP